MSGRCSLFWTWNGNFSTSKQALTLSSNLHKTASLITYSKDQFFKIRHTGQNYVTNLNFVDLRNAGLFHPRGTRAGLRRRTSNIKIISTNIQAGDRRVCYTSVIPKGINGNNLIPINCMSEPLNHRGKPLNFFLLNARSVCKPFKSLLGNDYIVDHDINLCVITETWLHGDNSDKFYCREIVLRATESTIYPGRMRKKEVSPWFIRDL